MSAGQTKKAASKRRSVFDAPKPAQKGLLPNREEAMENIRRANRYSSEIGSEGRRNLSLAQGALQGGLTAAAMRAVLGKGKGKLIAATSAASGVGAGAGTAMHHRGSAKRHEKGGDPRGLVQKGLVSRKGKTKKASAGVPEFAVVAFYDELDAILG